MDNSKHISVDKQEIIFTNLNFKQYCAIELLLTGKTEAEVAQIVGVDSEILWHWRTQEPEFVIAMNSLRAAVWEASIERLRNAMSKALDVVEQAVARGDEMVAIALLQALGVSNVQTANPQVTTKSNSEVQPVEAAVNPKVKTNKLKSKISLLDVSRF